MATKKIRVVVAGASGETGGSITRALLESPDEFEVQALARPESVNKPAYRVLQDQGVQVISADLTVVSEELVSALRGTDVVISCLVLTQLAEMNNLALLCHQAQVGRYVPSFWATVAPRGVMGLRDGKEGMLDFIKQLYLPYTVIDVGWWYQMCIPTLPSGKFDGRLRFPATHITGTGSVEAALIDNRDIGKYVVHIIKDPRTLNQMVFVYNEIWTENKVWDLMEKLSGERLPRVYIDEASVRKEVEDAKKSFPHDQQSRLVTIGVKEYDISRVIRGDNMPEKAKYLGYLLGKDLYPDVQGTSLHDYFTGILDGTIELPYAGRE